MCLTEQGEQHGVVERHDEQVDTGESGAGFEVAERLSHLTGLPTAANKHLRRQRKILNTVFFIGFSIFNLSKLRK